MPTAKQAKFQIGDFVYRRHDGMAGKIIGQSFVSGLYTVFWEGAVHPVYGYSDDELLLRDLKEPCSP